MRKLSIFTYLLITLLSIIVLIESVILFNSYIETNKKPPTSSVITDEIQSAANKFLTYAKTKNISEIFSMLDSEKQKETTIENEIKIIDETDSLFHLDEVLSVKKSSEEDFTYVYKDHTRNPAKKYVGTINFKNYPEGTLTISFVKENKTWKVATYQFNRQQTFKTGNYYSDMLQVKKYVSFTLYQPTKLNSGYTYDGATYLSINGKTSFDGQSYPTVWSTFSTNDSSSSTTLKKKLLFSQTGFSTTFEELTKYFKSKLKADEKLETISDISGNYLYYISPTQTTLIFIKGSSCFQIVNLNAISKENLIFTAQTLAEVK